VEWPTVLVAIGCWAGWVAMLVWHDALPWPLVLIGFALLGGWYMSLQHEVLHGHPTPWAALNTAIAFPPISLWLPYRVYRDSHLLHHEVELTAPGVDPESFYVSPQQWEDASSLRRLLLRVNRTFIGRLTIGPLLGPPALVMSELRLARHDRSLARMWAAHLAWVVVISIVVVGIADVPVWQYLVGYCWMGMSVVYVRSFVEHLAVAPPATRSAVVRSNWFFGLLFLNNNLHHAHHAAAGAAWYRLPRLAAEMDAAGIAAEGAGLYRGYAQVFLRFAFRPFSTPVSPMVGAESRS